VIDRILNLADGQLSTSKEQTHASPPEVFQQHLSNSTPKNNASSNSANSLGSSELSVPIPLPAHFFPNFSLNQFPLSPRSLTPPLIELVSPHSLLSQRMFCHSSTFSISSSPYSLIHSPTLPSFPRDFHARIP